MFKFLVICGCLLAIANGVFGGLIAAPAAIAVQPATIALPSLATTSIIKAPLTAAIAPAAAWAQPTIGWSPGAWGSAAPLGLGLKLG
ncbi:unnamed protein product [Lasius platythorax]|uniref:Uncharacterized protein n=1 Tax=Lasius platythorax TaxID=488582 RepID=A0AAV2NTB6_9HYME